MSITAYRGANANWALDRFIGRGFRLRATELITILNCCHRFRRFVYQHARPDTEDYVKDPDGYDLQIAGKGMKSSGPALAPDELINV